MSTVKATPYYLFTREQLLGALEAYGQQLQVLGGAVQGTVLEFLDSDVAKEHGLVVAPAPIPVGDNTV
ncbi:hypothetical protein [Solimonas sp. SE-A11]|uniref:hypothetical protein n=1 Tax=Solimonas sp. SE-A11 TaxID=3054954 RepID=UPI00259CA087|nr:hypothetical protein [Solimonas sp. SE-A11]MDM4768650.1 hypothetical protein [Solimonas sp. SE-A11]